MGTSRLFSFQQLGEMESMNHVSMDVKDDQALIKKVGLKCPRCESINTKFYGYQNNLESQPRHYCKDCRRGWSVNGKLRDIAVGGGERKRRQPDVSGPDHTQKGLKCSRCESANTKFLFYKNQDKSKPCHFCNDCQQHWTLNGKLRDFPVSGGKRERQQPETSASYQGLIALECPRCQSSNTKFMNYHWPKPVHFCNNCQRHWTIGGSTLRDRRGGGQKHWTVNGKLRDTPVGGGKRERQQSEFSAKDLALVARVGLECPLCKATSTKCLHYRCQNLSKPIHFCFSCQRYWTEGGNLRKRLKGGKWKIRQPETSMANQARMYQAALKCPRCESTNTNFIRHSNNKEPKPVHFCNNCQRYWSAGCSLRTKLQLKRSGLQASVEGQEETWQFDGSGEMASIGGSESNVTSTECSKSLGPSADNHRPSSVWPEKFDSHIEKGSSEGFPFNDEVTPNEKVYLNNGLKSVESPESSYVVENSSCVEKCNSSNDFCCNAKGVKKAHQFSVDVTTTTSRQLTLEPPQERCLPFIKSSCMWPQVESMEVFRSMPQQPHYNPLKEQNEHLCEGEAIGLMLSFTKLVEVTRKAQLDDSRTIFDMKLKALQILEEHGFSVQPVRSQLVKLLQIKESCGQLNGQLTTVTLEVKAELESVALLDMDIQMLKEKKEMKAFKVAELQRTSVEIEESIWAARSNFDELVAAPWSCNSQPVVCGAWHECDNGDHINCVGKIGCSCHGFNLLVSSMSYCCAW